MITPESLILDIESFSITDRGRQLALGVSEVGMDCRRCVARKLALYEKTQMTGSWRAQLGTYVHAGLAEDFAKKYTNGELIIEDGLIVHQYKDFILRGHCDVFAPNGGRGHTFDWKIVGDDTLAKVASGDVKQQYKVQGHLYSLGWEMKGYPVEDVTLMFLPANKGNLQRDAVPYSFKYDRGIAAEALGKIEDLIDAAEKRGWDEVVRNQHPDPGCLSCASYRKVDDPIFDLTAGFTKKENGKNGV